MIIPPELIAAKNLVQWTILALPGVVGIGIGLREENGVLFDELAIRIDVSDKSQVPAGIPEEVGGVGVSIIETVIEPCALPDESRYNPIVGGIKIVKPSRGNGTLGAVVQDSATGELLGLSCFHVVGDVNANFPDTIWQPKEPNMIQGSTNIPPDDNIGRVVRVDFPQTQPLPFSPVLAGFCDAAVFTLVPALEQGRALSPGIVAQDAPDILIDRITDTALATELPIGTEVRKRGFRTGLTEGIIIDASKTVQWTAGPPNSYIIDQVVVAGSSSNPAGMFLDVGDSGSVVLLKNAPTAVGLLWGRSHGGSRGIMSSIRNVESQLGVKMAWL